MDVDIRDSSSLKPAELDVLSQVLRDAGSPLDDKALDQQVESFSRVSLVVAEDDEVQGFLFGSLERIGGTPCVLWGLGATRGDVEAAPVLGALTTELYRRAATTAFSPMATAPQSSRSVAACSTCRRRQENGSRTPPCRQPLSAAHAAAAS